MAKATAKHILVEQEEFCKQLKDFINEGELSFEEAAEQNSLCPSGNKGGDLGSFGEGMMVPEFDKVIFSEELGTIHGPVKTSFGYHLILITSRED